MRMIVRQERDCCQSVFPGLARIAHNSPMPRRKRGHTVRAAARSSTTTLLEMPLSGRPVIRPVVRTLVESLPDFGVMARRNRRLAQLGRDMEGATTYAAWREAALAWDTEAGLEEWKLDDASPLYDYKLIQRRLAQILGAREGGYLRRLMFLLQEGLHGNLGNLSNPLLYQCTRFGT